MTALTQLARAQEIRRAAALLADGGLLVVHGPWPTEAVAVARAAVEHPAARRRVARVIVGECSSDAELANAFIRAAGQALIGEPALAWLPVEQLSPEHSRIALDLRRALRIHGAVEDHGADGDLPLMSVIGAVVPLIADAGAVLVVESADELLTGPRGRFADAGESLWTLRSTAQRLPELVIVLTGGPNAAALIEDDRQAFLGWGRTLYLDRVPEDRLAEAVVHAFNRSLDLRTATEIAALAEGAPWVAELVAQRILGDEIRTTATDSASPALPPLGPAQVWSALVAQLAPTLELTLRAIAEAHRTAHAVAKALAWDDPPYSVGSPSDVNRALRALHRTAHVERAGKRAWRLCDPLLAEWIRQTTLPAR